MAVKREQKGRCTVREPAFVKLADEPLCLSCRLLLELVLFFCFGV